MADRDQEEDMEVDDQEFLATQEGICSADQGTQLSKQQVPNVAHKFVFQPGLETELACFLRFGHSANAYSSGGRGLETIDSECLLELIRNGKGPRAVKMIKEFSEKHLAYKQDYVICALAICCRSTEACTKRAAYDALPDVCRIPTHLFKFVDYCQKISKEQSSKSGWGRAHRKAISKWYIQHANVEEHLSLMAYHLTKYRKRQGWAHRDVIRKSHLNIDRDFRKAVNNKLYPALKYLVMVAVKSKSFADSNAFTIEQKGLQGFESSVLAKAMAYMEQVEEARKKDSEDVAGICGLILKHKLVREHIPTPFLKHKDVWKALARHMPMTAMLRNLGRMSRLKCFEKDSKGNDSFEENLVLGKLQNKELITRGRIHPMAYMIALNQYKKGKNRNGKKEWPPLPAVINALKGGFNISLKCIKPTNKRILLAFGAIKSIIDDSAMCVGMPLLSALEAAAFLIMLTAKTEESCEILVFSNNGNYHPLTLEANDGEEEIVQKLKASCHHSDTSDGSLPFKYALAERKYDFDAFVILTDSNTSSGHVHPSEAFKAYCETVKPQPQRKTQPRLVVCDMLSSHVTIGDPADHHTLNISGFDYNVPRIINDFVRGDS